MTRDLRTKNRFLRDEIRQMKRDMVEHGRTMWWYGFLTGFFVAVVLSFFMVFATQARGAGPDQPGTQVTSRVVETGTLAYVQRDTKRARALMVRRGWRMPKIDRVRNGKGVRGCGNIACAFFNRFNQRIVAYQPVLFRNSKATLIVRGKRVRTRPSCTARLVEYHELQHHPVDLKENYRDVLTGRVVTEYEVMSINREILNHSAIEWVSKVYALQDKRRGRCLGQIRYADRHLSALARRQFKTWKRAERYLKRQASS